MIKFDKIFIILSVVWLSIHPADQNNQAKVCNVTIYYESFCMTSRYVMSQEVPAAYKELKNQFILNAIPYGAAQTSEKNGKISFTCQHGPEECKGNKIQGCMIPTIKNNYKEDSMARLVKYLSDFMRVMPPYSNNSLKYFPEKNKTIQKQFTDCVNSDKGNQIMAEYGRLTVQARPTGIPYMVLNGKANSNARGNLLDECCKLLGKMPPKCKKDCGKK